MKRDRRPVLVAINAGIVEDYGESQFTRCVAWVNRRGGGHGDGHGLALAGNDIGTKVEIQVVLVKIKLTGQRGRV